MKCDICNIGEAALFAVVRQFENTKKAHVCVDCFGHLQNKAGKEYADMTVETVSQQEFNEVKEKSALHK